MDGIGSSSTRIRIGVLTVVGWLRFLSRWQARYTVDALREVLNLLADMTADETENDDDREVEIAFEEIRAFVEERQYWQRKEFALRSTRRSQKPKNVPDVGRTRRIGRTSSTNGGSSSKR